jgi:hypothetical protein
MHLIGSPYTGVAGDRVSKENLKKEFFGPRDFGHTSSRSQGPSSVQLPRWVDRPIEVASR